MMKSYVEPVSFQLHLSSANKGLDCSDMLRDSPTMFQQTRSSRPAAKLKTVYGHHPQTKAWTVRTCCETRRRCSSKPDPPDLLQSSRQCTAITRLEACSRSTSHYMDPSDLPGHGNTGDWCSRAGRGQIVLATNCNGGMLWLIASCHDDGV